MDGGGCIDELPVSTAIQAAAPNHAADPYILGLAIRGVSSLLDLTTTADAGAALGSPEPPQRQSHLVEGMDEDEAQ